MIKKIKLMMWKRKIKLHKGFSEETNNFIKRLATYTGSQVFIDLSINEQIDFILRVPSAIQSLEFLMQTNKFVNTFFDLINSKKD